MPDQRITVSVVSHRQNFLVNALLADLDRCSSGDVVIVITHNTYDPVPLEVEHVGCPIEVLVNPRPKGFAANHNAGFARCRTPFFCVANPDIRLHVNPFPPLLKSLADERVGVVGPLVRSPAGTTEDSARRYPSLFSLIRKLWVPPSGPDYATDRGPTPVDWIAGMFMVFRSETFRSIGGFDEEYFMYYEDVDLCRRIHSKGKTVLYNPAAEVVHDARKASRRNPRLAVHHLASAARFLFLR